MSTFLANASKIFKSSSCKKPRVTYLNYTQGLEIHVHVVIEKFILEYRTNFKI